jgi:acetylxylan esterase
MLFLVVQCLPSRMVFWLTRDLFKSIDAEQLKQWSNVLGLTTSKTSNNNPQSGYTQTIYGDGTSATAQLVGYSAQGVGHTVPQHPDLDIAFFGI